MKFDSVHMCINCCARFAPNEKLGIVELKKNDCSVDGGNVLCMLRVDHTTAKFVNSNIAMLYPPVFKESFNE